jgi:hypothetical protein
MFEILKKLTFIALGIYLVYFVSSQLFTFFSTGGQLPTNISFAMLTMGSLFYFLSHFTRAIRLLILSSDPNISFRELISAQYVANGVNLLMPFRLGEVYRIYKFIEFFKSGYRSFLFLLIERIFDFSFILALILGLQYFFNSIDLSSLLGGAIIWGSSIFFLCLLITLFVLDDFLEIVQRYILQRYTSTIVNKVLKVVFYIRRALDDIFYALKKKWFSCLILTSVIWGLEIIVFAGFYSVTGSIESLLYLAVFVFLSSLLPSGPIGYGGIQLAFYYVGQQWNLQDFIIYSIWYNVFIFLPAIILAFLLSFRSMVSSKNENNH